MTDVGSGASGPRSARHSRTNHALVSHRVIGRYPRRLAAASSRTREQAHPYRRPSSESFSRASSLPAHTWILLAWRFFRPVRGQKGTRFPTISEASMARACPRRHRCLQQVDDPSPHPRVPRGAAPLVRGARRRGERLLNPVHRAAQSRWRSPLSPCLSSRMHRPASLGGRPLVFAYPRIAALFPCATSGIVAVRLRGLSSRSSTGGAHRRAPPGTTVSDPFTSDDLGPHVSKGVSVSGGLHHPPRGMVHVRRLRRQSVDRQKSIARSPIPLSAIGPSMVRESAHRSRAVGERYLELDAVSCAERLLDDKARRLLKGSARIHLAVW